MQQQIREYYRNALKYRSIRIFGIEYLDMSINGNVSKKNTCTFIDCSVVSTKNARCVEISCSGSSLLTLCN